MYTCKPNVDINTISIIRISPYSKTYFLKKKVQIVLLGLKIPKNIYDVKKLLQILFKIYKFLYYKFK